MFRFIMVYSTISEYVLVCMLTEIHSFALSVVLLDCPGPEKFPHHFVQQHISLLFFALHMDRV